MKKHLFSYLSGVLTALLVVGLIGTAAATVGSKTATLDYNNISVTLDGHPVALVDANGNAVEPFAIAGTTYLPVRAVASALGLNVNWNSATSTVELATKGAAQGQNPVNPPIPTTTPAPVPAPTQAQWRGPSTYKVGTDIPAGEYYLKADESQRAYFEVTSDSSGDNILDNENFDHCYFITVENGQYLQVKRASFTESSNISAYTDNPKLSSGNMYRVGTDIPAGEYKLQSESGERGYYCVYDSSKVSKEIVANDNFEGAAYITASNGQYLWLSRCSGSL